MHDNIPKLGSDRVEARALAVSQTSWFSIRVNPQTSAGDLHEETFLQLPMEVVDEVLPEQF